MEETQVLKPLNQKKKLTTLKIIHFNKKHLYPKTELHSKENKKHPFKKNRPIKQLSNNYNKC
jgi:hypothetical protein